MLLNNYIGDQKGHGLNHLGAGFLSIVLFSVEKKTNLHTQNSKNKQLDFVQQQKNPTKYFWGPIKIHHQTSPPEKNGPPYFTGSNCGPNL